MVPTRSESQVAKGGEAIPRFTPVVGEADETGVRR